jgi:hypothetical protein
LASIKPSVPSLIHPSLLMPDAASAHVVPWDAHARRTTSKATAVVGRLDLTPTGKMARSR